MRKRLTLTLALGAMVAMVFAGIATAYKPVVVQAGNLKLTFNGGITPTKLPKSKLAPIGLNVSAKIQSVDGTHPQALQKFIVETDKNGSVEAKGYPTCKKGALEARTTTEAKKACPDSIVGSGTTEVEVLFPESKPIPIKSQLVAFNGGVKGGKTQILIHAYLSNPIAAAIVTDVKVEKHKNGKYGLKSTASVPVIAGGDGSVTNFNLTINKKFKVGGKKKSYLNAKCPSGRLFAQGEAVFAGGLKAKGAVSRPCTPKG